MRPNRHTLYRDVEGVGISFFFLFFWGGGGGGGVLQQGIKINALAEIKYYFWLYIVQIIDTCVNV